MRRHGAGQINSPQACLILGRLGGQDKSRYGSGVRLIVMHRRLCDIILRLHQVALTHSAFDICNGHSHFTFGEVIRNRVARLRRGNVKLQTFCSSYSWLGVSDALC